MWTLQVGRRYVSWIKAYSCDLGQADRVVDPREGRWGPNVERMHLCFLLLINICTVTVALFTFRCLFWDCFVWPCFLLCINCAGTHLSKPCLWPLRAMLIRVTLGATLHMIGILSRRGGDVRNDHLDWSSSLNPECFFSGPVKWLNETAVSRIQRMFFTSRL